MSKIDDDLAALRDLIAHLDRVERRLPDLLPRYAGDALCWRASRLKDALARARGQVGHMAAELVLAPAECWRQAGVPGAVARPPVRPGPCPVD